MSKASSASVMQQSGQRIPQSRTEYRNDNKLITYAARNSLGLILDTVLMVKCVNVYCTTVLCHIDLWPEHVTLR